MGFGMGDAISPMLWAVGNHLIGKNVVKPVCSDERDGCVERKSGHFCVCVEFIPGYLR